MILEQLRNRAERIAESLPSPSPGTRPTDVDPDSNRGLGYQMLLEFGFDAEQWPYLDALWRRESGWNHLAENRSSGAYGIPQSLPASKMAVVGEDWHTNRRPRSPGAWPTSPPATATRRGLGPLPARRVVLTLTGAGRAGAPAGSCVA